MWWKMMCFTQQEENKKRKWALLRLLCEMTKLMGVWENDEVDV